MKIWDSVSGACLFTLLGHKEEVNSAVFNYAGTQIVSASSDYTMRIWDATSGKCMLKLVGHINEVNSAVFNNAGTQVFSAS